MKFTRRHKDLYAVYDITFIITIFLSQRYHELTFDSSLNSTSARLVGRPTSARILNFSDGRRVYEVKRVECTGFS